MFLSASSIQVLVLVGFSFLMCKVQGIFGTEQQIVNEEESLKCYDCNSEYDPRCGDPFNPYTIGIINCTDRKTPEHLTAMGWSKPVVCRKLKQKIEGKIRIIRGCGYVPDKKDNDECVMRSGTKNINIHYCACTKSLCNTGHYQQRPSFSIITLAVAITLAIKSSYSHLLA